MTVDCVGESNHAARTDGLLPGTYSIGEVYWSGTSTEGAYYVDITIEDENYDAYVTRYDTDTAGDETHTVVAGEDESKTITLKHEGGEWTVPTGAIPVTIDVACGTDPTLPAEEHIWVEVYLDGRKVNNEALNLVTFVAPADDLVWDADNLRYTLDLGNDPGNVTFNLPAPSEGTRDYLLRAIVADLVYAASGTAPNMGENAATEDPDDYQITSIKDQSTLKIYLGQEYTVVYSVPSGYESQVTADTNTYIIAQTWPGTSMDYPTTEGDFRDDCLWENPSVTTALVDESLKTAIMLHPTISGLTGWSIDGTTYSSPVQVSAVAGEADENHVITFTATTSGNPPSGSANVTVTKDLTKVGTIDITSSTMEIPSAKEDDVIEWTITVENVGGEAQITNVTITEILDGAVIAQPAATGDYYTVSDDGTTITVSGLPAGGTETITVTYTVTAADVEAGTAIKNSVTVDDGDGDAPETVEPDEDVPVVEADILDDPVIFHSVNGSTFETTDARQDTAEYEHLVTTTDPTISYQAVLDLSAMELQNTSNTNQSVLRRNIYETMKDNPWGLMKQNLFWGMLEYSDTIINLCVDFDDQLDVTETAMQNVTVTSPYFDRVGNVTYDSTTGYWKIPCQAKAQVNTTEYTNPDEVILSGITLNLTSAAQSALNTSKVLTLTSGGYIDGTVTFGGDLSALNPLTVYGEATDDVVNLALDAWDDGDNTETGGDGIPDYQQALIKYVSANTSYGTVNPATEVVTLTGMTGNTGTATISGSTASANSGYSFTNWTNTASLSAVTSATLGAQTFTAQGGSTYTFTANFTSSGGSDPGTGGSESDPYLRFDSNGGTEFDPIDENGRDFSINVYDDDHYGTHIPTRPGYRFTGWYTTNTLRTRIDEDEILRVTSYRTVFAGWEETSVPSMLNGDDHYAYIQGYSDGTVRPNANITRAQVATIFFRLLDEDVRSDYLTTYNPFPDVNADYWANTAISTMASLGVINGRNSGLFDPDAYITRAEFAAICARFDDSDASGFDSFTDTFGHWAEEEIGRAAALGWIQGYDDGTFRPNQYITRAQAVTMINRVLCRLPEDEDDLLPGMNVWTDCREGDWCYLAIQEATNSHDYVTKDRVYETWTDLNRAPDWSQYE